MKYKVLHDYNDMGHYVSEGEFVYEFFGFTPCVEDGMVAVTRKENERAFFEVPRKYLELVY